MESWDKEKVEQAKKNLEGAELKGLDLSGADLKNANLISANLVSANLSGADLSGAKMFGAKAMRADLRNANLSGASLLKANFSRANFQESNLNDADIMGANLSDTNLTKASLIRTKLVEANNRLETLLEATRTLAQTYDKFSAIVKTVDYMLPEVPVTESTRVHIAFCDNPQSFEGYAHFQMPLMRSQFFEVAHPSPPSPTQSVSPA